MKHQLKASAVCRAVKPAASPNAAARWQSRMRIKSIQEMLLYFLQKIAVLKTAAVLKIGMSKIYLLPEKDVCHFRLLLKP